MWWRRAPLVEGRGIICLWCRTKASGIERWSVGNRHVPFITRFVTERQEARSRPCLTSRYPPALTSRHRAPATCYRGVSGVVRHWYRKTSGLVKYLVWRGGPAHAPTSAVLPCWRTPRHTGTPRPLLYYYTSTKLYYWTPLLTFGLPSLLLL